MIQEARNTERHTLGWGNSRLRDNAVSFVSAGNLVREDPESSSSQEEEDVSAQVQVDAREESVNRQAAETPPTSGPQTPKAEDNDAVSKNLNRQEPSAAAEAEAEASSSEDEVVFAGRKPGDLAIRQKQPPPEQQTTIKQPVPVPIPRSPEVLTHPPMSSLSDNPTPSKPGAVQRPRRRWQSRHNQRTRQEEEEDAYLQDYIDNMNMEDDEDDEDEEEKAEPNATTAMPQRRNEHFRFHKGDGLENAKVQLKAVRSTKKKLVQAETDGWDSADLDVFDDLSTSGGEDDDFEADRVLRHRDRPGGKQYLVTAAGMTIDDAKWLPEGKLGQPQVKELIQTYEISAMERLAASTDEESGDEDEEEEDLIDEIGSEQDENDRILDRTSRMTDEQIARALDMQERLGMGGDEVKLWQASDLQDLDEDDDEDDFDIDEFMGGDGFIPFSASKHTSNRGRSKRNRRGRDSFPNAGAFADALEQDPYGAFDVMDWDRPSLRAKRKGRKTDFPYDLDGVDDELAEGLVDAWTKDRQKKAARKMEKEEARVAILQGSDPAAIKLRIRNFLVSETQQELELTPMDAHVRAGVHRLAKVLNMTSRSHGKEGKGVGRYPVLMKTPFTRQYTTYDIWEADAILEARKFFPQKSYKLSKPGKSTPITRGNRGGVAAASYANGEIIGAAAPEIGVENRGRAMLEKMGWSAGMGIGAVGNKGSLDAIKQVVKTNKAGLG